MLSSVPCRRFQKFSLPVALFLPALVVFLWGTLQAARELPGPAGAQLEQLGLRWDPRNLFQGLAGPSGERFLWSTPRNGGFNNQLITVYEALRCAQLLGRTLVLPLMYSNVRYDVKAANGTGPFPFSDYFDLGALSAAGVVRFIVPSELGAAAAAAAAPCAEVVHTEKPPLAPPRLLRDVLAPRLGFALRYSAWPNPREKCFDDSVCRRLPLEAPDELGAYSDYAADGQGYSIRRSRVLQTLRRALRPSRTVQAVADAVMAHIGTEYNAVHVRRGDYRDKCGQMEALCVRFGNNSFWQSPARLRSVIRDFRDPHLPLFVSTTHADECREMLRGIPNRVVYMEDVPLPKSIRWTRKRVDIGSFASQVVAAGAREFVGNRFSSYTTTINYERLLRNMNETLVFF